MSFLRVLLLVGLVVGSTSQSPLYKKNNLKMLESIKSSTRLILDQDFVDCSISEEDFYNLVKHFKKNKFNESEVYYIYVTAKHFKISPLVILAKIEMESSLVSNWMNWKTTDKKYIKRKSWLMGYGVYTGDIKNNASIKTKSGFVKQIYSGTSCLKYHYDNWATGKSVSININKKTITVANASSYALYKYTPFYGKFSDYGSVCSGNEHFVEIFRSYKKILTLLKN